MQTTFSLVRNSLFHLLDGALEEAYQLRIVKTLAEHFDAYHQVHHIRSRRAGAFVSVELFLEFEKSLPHGAILDHCREIKRSLEEAIPASVVWVIPVDADFSGLGGVPACGSS
jgi:ferrous-iron efflux pump FieF